MKKLIVIVILGLLLVGCADIHAYDAQLAEKDATIAKLQNELLSKDAEIVNLKSELAENPEYISELRFFETVYELKTFLMNDDTDSKEYIPGKFDCDHFALTLMLNAEKSGYRVGLFPDIANKHMKNVAFVGKGGFGDFWIIEPQDDTIEYAGTLY
ncbi:MAG: hypothetical protein WC372_12040 [Candidatus Neomarinimicrobiota bacterium]|jgi:hypothetical protein